MKICISQLTFKLILLKIIDRLNAELSQLRIENGRLKADMANESKILKDEIENLKSDLQKERSKKGKGKKRMTQDAPETAALPPASMPELG